MSDSTAREPKIRDIWSEAIHHAPEKTPLAPEVPKAPEIVKMPEAPKLVRSTENGGPAVSTPASPVVSTVVDVRTGKEKTHRVDPTADSMTKEADLEEQEFIEGVEEVHSII